MLSHPSLMNPVRDFMSVCEIRDLQPFQKILEDLKQEKHFEESSPYSRGLWGKEKFSLILLKRLNKYIEMRKEHMAAGGRDWCEEWETFRETNPDLMKKYSELISHMDAFNDNAKKELLEDNPFIKSKKKKKKPVEEEEEEQKTTKITKEEIKVSKKKNGNQEEEVEEKKNCSKVETTSKKRKRSYPPATETYSSSSSSDEEEEDEVQALGKKVGVLEQEVEALKKQLAEVMKRLQGGTKELERGTVAQRLCRIVKKLTKDQYPEEHFGAKIRQTYASQYHNGQSEEGWLPWEREMVEARAKQGMQKKERRKRKEKQTD